MVIYPLKNPLNLGNEINQAKPHESRTCGVRQVMEKSGFNDFGQDKDECNCDEPAKEEGC